MAKLYRSLGRNTVRVTLEVPVSVVAVLVASARADHYVDRNASAERIVPQLLAHELCLSACMAADYMGNEGQGLRCFGLDCPDDENGIPFPQRLYDVLPEVRGPALIPSLSSRLWWLKPGRGPKQKRH